MKLPRLVHNRISYLGAAIAGVAFIVFVFLFVFETLTGAGHVPYAGLVIFIVIPAAILFGLFLIPAGMFFEWRRWKHGGVGPLPRFPIIDLNNPGHRNAMFLFAVGSVLLLFFSSFGSYEAYHYTESVSFCGRLCHQVMNPEYTTYLNSPHARVPCVACHVGPGAGWFVRSKLSGTYQVYAVLFDKYPRPIPTPIKHLRPAQATCEQCHWPQQFFGGQQRRLVHFLPDEKNTRWEINLLIKTGGGSPGTGQTEGIHWHMNIANKVEYIATDVQRQNIPWVRVTNLKTGKVVVYKSTTNPLSKEQIVTAHIRRMDCMDCHNRPTHIIKSPSAALNLALATGRIDPSLPFIKRTGVQLLAAKYASVPQALDGIRQGVTRFYRQKYPEVLQEKEGSVSQAISELDDIYRKNFFPYMKVRWSVYPDNVGHFTSLGCYRCHDGRHRSAGGKVIPRSCTTCHIIMSQGEPGHMEYSEEPSGLPFRHPVDIGGAWRQMLCSDCHTGRAP